jgi:hypothetical protein
MTSWSILENMEPACRFSSARAFTLAQMPKKLKTQVSRVKPYYVKFFYPLDEVKASQVKNYKLVHIRKYGPACNFSSARAFTFAQRAKELNIVGEVDAESVLQLN